VGYDEVRGSAEEDADRTVLVPDPPPGR